MGMDPVVRLEAQPPAVRRVVRAAPPTRDDMVGVLAVMADIAADAETGGGAPAERLLLHLLGELPAGRDGLRLALPDRMPLLPGPSVTVAARIVAGRAARPAPCHPSSPSSSSNRD